MKWFLNLKINQKLFLSYIVFLSILICLSVFFSAQISGIGENYRVLLDLYIWRQNKIAGVITEFSNIRNLNHIKTFVAEGDMNPEYVEELLDNYNAYAASFMTHLDEYRASLNVDVYFSEEEKQLRLICLDKAEDLFVNGYQPLVRQLDAALESYDAEGLSKLNAEGIAIGGEISGNLEALYDLISLSVAQKTEEARLNSGRAIILGAGIAVALILLSFYTLSYTSKVIKTPILGIEDAMAEISKGNLNYPIRIDQKDEIGILSNRIGDMIDSIYEMNKTMAVMDYLDVMITVIDPGFNLLYINRRAADVYGADRESCVGQKCYQILQGYDSPCPACRLSALMNDWKSFPSIEYEHEWDEKAGAWVGGRAAVILWVDGTTAFLNAASDVTLKMRQEEQLREALEEAKAASAAKTTFLANMSHEIRTPLNVVVGLADLQLEEETLPADTKDSLEKIRAAGGTLLSIVNDVLDISKIESGRLTLMPVEYYLASLINDTLMISNTLIGEKPIAFHPDIGGDLPERLFGDDLRVKQILHNLLINAIKYTHEGTIGFSLRCTRDGDSVWMEIVVSDTGIGIQKENLDDLFSDYYQVDAKASREIEGTGLGLPITRRLTELMDGEISVDSEYGKGSVFRARLRQGFVSDKAIGESVAENLRQSRHREDKHYHTDKLIRIDLSGARVLVVDDMKANLEVSAGLMRKYKMKVDGVTSGFIAIERIRNGEPAYDAIFMDHMMPGMDGIETADRIRALGTAYARTIPIIALTANAIAGTEELFFQHDFQAFLSKPIDIMQLDFIIRKWIRIGKPNAEISYVEDAPAPEGGPLVDIPGIDAEKGLTVCDGDRKVYRSMLRSYAADVSAVLERIATVTEEGLPAYIIAVHGVKGSSANIGAEKIRAAALDLEMAAKAGDLPGILARNGAFLEDTKRLVADIRDWFAKLEAGREKPRLDEPDRALLAGLGKACEDFDIEEAEKVLEELESAEYEKDADLVLWLRDKVDTMEFSEAAERLAVYR